MTTGEREACAYHSVSSAYTNREVRAALDVVRASWRRVRRAAGSCGAHAGRGMRRIAEGTRGHETSLARWPTHRGGDYKALRLAMDEVDIDEHAREVLGDALDALSCAHYNGEAACEECRGES